MSDQPDQNETITINISQDISKERLDKYLGNDESLKLSRSKLQKLIESGLVTVDDKPATGKQKLTGGEKIVIKMPPPEIINIKAENIPLNIVFEDEYMLVVNKPAGMVTHPATSNYTGTLVNALMYYTKDLSTVGGRDRLGIVHRLDRNTSGLIMIAKKDEAHVKLQNDLQEHNIEKIYYAIVCGHMVDDSGKIELPIGRAIKDRKKMAVTHRGGRDALTEYKLLDRYKLYDLLEVNLRTGRTHQIRVHFSFLGHPVLGDPEYGGRKKWHKGVISYDKLLAKKSQELIDRQALHAKSLKFNHPITGVEVYLDSDLPDDFAGLVEYLDKEGR